MNSHAVNRHYPLKVACLPIPPPTHLCVPRTGLEPARSQNHSHLKRARLPIPPPGHSIIKRAEDGTRTRDPNLGKVMLYQLSYFRMVCFSFAIAKVEQISELPNFLSDFLLIFFLSFPIRLSYRHGFCCQLALSDNVAAGDVLGRLVLPPDCQCR